MRGGGAAMGMAMGHGHGHGRGIRYPPRSTIRTHRKFDSCELEYTVAIVHRPSASWRLPSNNLAFSIVMRCTTMSVTTTTTTVTAATIGGGAAGGRWRQLMRPTLRQKSSAMTSLSLLLGMLQLTAAGGSAAASGEFQVGGAARFIRMSAGVVTGTAPAAKPTYITGNPLRNMPPLPKAHHVCEGIPQVSRAAGARQSAGRKSVCVCGHVTVYVAIRREHAGAPGAWGAAGVGEGGVEM